MKHWMGLVMLAGCQSYVDLAVLENVGDTAVAFDAEMFVGVGVTQGLELEILVAVNAAGEPIEVELSSGGGLALPGTEYCVLTGSPGPPPVGFQVERLRSAKPVHIGAAAGDLCESFPADRCYAGCQRAAGAWDVDHPIPQ